MSLLTHDNKLVKDLSLSEVHELPKEEKVSFVDAQIDGIKAQLWRSRVDLMLNYGLKTEGKEQKKAVATKIDEHLTDIERFAEALTLLDELKKEL